MIKSKWIKMHSSRRLLASLMQGKAKKNADFDPTNPAVYI